MKYLVCRTDSLRPAGTMKNSNHFPMIVEVLDCDWDGTDWAEIVLRKALNSIKLGYETTYKYTIVPMSEAVDIQRKPVQEYETVMTTWC